MTAKIRERRFEKNGALIIALEIPCGSGLKEKLANRAALDARRAELDAEGFIVSRAGAGGTPMTWHSRGVKPRWMREDR